MHWRLGLFIGPFQVALPLTIKESPFWHPDHGMAWFDSIGPLFFFFLPRSAFWACLTAWTTCKSIWCNLIHYGMLLPFDALQTNGLWRFVTTNKVQYNVACPIFWEVCRVGGTTHDFNLKAILVRVESGCFGDHASFHMIVWWHGLVVRDIPQYRHTVFSF